MCVWVKIEGVCCVPRTSRGDMHGEETRDVTGKGPVGWRTPPASRRLAKHREAVA